MEPQQWLAAHAPQLQQQDVPQHLWPALQAKLTEQRFDAGEHVMLDWGPDEGWRVNALAALSAADPSAIFLVDHAWTYTRGTARQTLMGVDGLLSRVAGLLDMEDDDDGGGSADGDADDADDADLKAALLEGAQGQVPVDANTAIAIKGSTIPEAGDGAFAAVALAAGTFLGTYQGEKLNAAAAQEKYPLGNAYYVLAVPGSDDLLIDAADASKSNWLRYLNHSRGKGCNCVMLDGALVVATRKVEVGEELFFDYGRSYWKKAYFFANGAKKTEDAVAAAKTVQVGGVAAAQDLSAADDATAAGADADGSTGGDHAGGEAGGGRDVDEKKVAAVVARLSTDASLKRCCYRVAAVADGCVDGGDDDEGLAYFLMDEVGSRVRTITAAEAAEAAEAATAAVGADGAISVGAGDGSKESAEARASRLGKLEMEVQCQPEPEQQPEPEPAQEPEPDTMAGIGRACVSFGLLHHLAEGVMYSLFWPVEDAVAGDELICVL